MPLQNPTEVKRLTRQIRARFPEWKIEDLLFQDMNRNIFKVSQNGKTAHLYVVSFPLQEQIENSDSRIHWHQRAENYLAWIQKLCGIQNCDVLALPVTSACTLSFPCRRVETVFALLPELRPLDEQLQHEYSPMEIAQMFYSVCRALHRCREERIPHGELITQHLMQKADGGYCLAGMLEVQRLDDFNEMMPAELSEIQQAALLIRQFLKENLSDIDSVQSVTKLQQLINRAAVREKGLTLQTIIMDLEKVIAELKQHSVYRAVQPASASMSAFQDLTDLFSTEGQNDTISVREKHTIPSSEVKENVGMRRRSAMENSALSMGKHAAEIDPDATISLWNQLEAASHEAIQKDLNDDDEQTIIML